MMPVLETLYTEYKVLVTTYHDTVKKLNQVAELIKTYGGDAGNVDEIRVTTIEEILSDIRDNLYPIDGTWADKITFTLQKFPGQALPGSKIYDFISRNEGDVFKKRGENGKTLIHSILSRMVKEKTLLVDSSSSKNKYKLYK